MRHTGGGISGQPRSETDPLHVQPTHRQPVRDDVRAIDAAGAVRGRRYARRADGGLAVRRPADPAAWMPPTSRLPVEVVAAIVERALPELPADIGLELGCSQHIGNFGLVGLAMSTAATFGEALQIGLRFTR